MSVSASWIFIYTPVPWAAILCIILYRHDLSQLLHPFKEKCSVRDWKSLFHDLEISLNVSSSSSTSRERNRILILVHRLRKDISERYPNIRFYCLALAVVAGSSLLSSLIVVPVMLGGVSFLDSRFSGLVSAGLQFVSAFPSIFAMQRHFGPFPLPSNKFHLRKSRPGSLIRYEKTLGRTSSDAK